MDSDSLAEQMVLDAIREAKRQIAEEQEVARRARRRWAMVAVWAVVIVATVAIWLVVDASGL